ncbi:MAG: rhomboid family intramembrane serine protease [Bacteroidetes bacterium]|nr:rhomboid family intramembrane serine protease [Bacteroidota bacterium]
MESQNMTNTNRPNRFMQSFSFPLKFLALIWGIHILQFITRIDLGYLGVYPKRLFGLKGVIFSPLIHADFHHLISNSVPLLALTVMIMFFYRKVAIKSFFMIYVLTGLAVWIFARQVFHIGASGVVYGLVSFVFWNGIFRKNLKSIILALIVTVLYSGYFAGILPNQEGISWESHLLGGLVGIFVSYWYKEDIEKDEKPTKYSWEEEEESTKQPYFLDRDVFEKTKEERLREKNENPLSDWFSSRTWKDNE